MVEQRFLRITHKVIFKFGFRINPVATNVKSRVLSIVSGGMEGRKRTFNTISK